MIISLIKCAKCEQWCIPRIGTAPNTCTFLFCFQSNIRTHSDENCHLLIYFVHKIKRWNRKRIKSSEIHWEVGQEKVNQSNKSKQKQQQQQRRRQKENNVYYFASFSWLNQINWIYNFVALCGMLQNRWWWWRRGAPKNMRKRKKKTQIAVISCLIAKIQWVWFKSYKLIRIFFSIWLTQALTHRHIHIATMESLLLLFKIDRSKWNQLYDFWFRFGLEFRNKKATKSNQGKASQKAMNLK